jgi:hypothetical protein
MWFLRDGMKISARRYATIASGKSLLRGKKGPPLSLEHVGTMFYTKVWACGLLTCSQFLQRGRVLALWRDIVRATNST